MKSIYNLRLATILLLLFLLTSCKHADDEGQKQRQINTTEPNGYCETPALLEGLYPPDAPGYIIYFKDEINAANEVNRLINTYTMEVGVIYDSIGGFFATMDQEIMEQLRCEDSIQSVHYNGIATIN